MRPARPRGLPKTTGTPARGPGGPRLAREISQSPEQGRARLGFREELCAFLVARIHQDLAAVLQIAEVRQRLLDIGGNPGGEPPDEFAARVRADIDKWKKVAQAAGVKPQ